MKSYFAMFLWTKICSGGNTLGGGWHWHPGPGATGHWHPGTGGSAHRQRGLHIQVDRNITDSGTLASEQPIHRVYNLGCQKDSLHIRENITLGSCTRLKVIQLEGCAPPHRESPKRDSCPGVSSTDIEVVLEASDGGCSKFSTGECVDVR